MRLNRNDLKQRLERIFQDNFDFRGELGASVSIWQAGESVLELHGGFRDVKREEPWDAQTIVLVWSATKGIGSACLLHALQENNVSLTRKVSEFWPEFAQNGKSDIEIGTMMSHASGLCALDKPVDVLDYPAVTHALEQQAPLWPPASAHGYHARTFGFLIDELMRRLTGIAISEYWQKYLAEPMKLDFWIGLPNELNDRVATTYAPKAGGTPDPPEFYRQLLTRGTLQSKVFNSPSGVNSISAMNKPEMRSQPIVSFGGIGSAEALAKFYCMLASDGVIDRRRYFQSATIGQMTTPLNDGNDVVFEMPTAFSAGFMKDSQSTRRPIFGPDSRCFGHPGAGGSHAFADPANGIGFAYVMNQMEQSVFPNERSLQLVKAMYQETG